MVHHVKTVPFKVNPKPLQCHPFLHNIYSEKPPGPAQMSAKYNRSIEPSSSFYLVGNTCTGPLRESIVIDRIRKL